MEGAGADSHKNCKRPREGTRLEVCTETSVGNAVWCLSTLLLLLWDRELLPQLTLSRQSPPASGYCPLCEGFEGEAGTVGLPSSIRPGEGSSESP